MSEHELWNELGNLYFVSGSYDKAARAYNRAIAINAEIGEPYSNLALTYAQMGKHAEAAKLYKRGIHLLKDDVDKAVSLHLLGDIYFHLKQFTRAAETYQQTENLVPDFGQIVDGSEPLDLLLHCQPSDLHQSQQPEKILDDTHSGPILDSEASSLTDDLTAWWLDGQVEHQDDDGFDYDFGYMDEEGYHYVSNNVVYTEPLKWELETVHYSDLTDDNVDVSHPKNIENALSVSDSVPDNADTNKSTDTISEKRRISADIKSEMDTLLVDLNPTGAIAVSAESEIVTKSPEFVVQNTTDVEAIQYDIPQDLHVVELSDDERHEIQVDIDKFKKALETNPRNAYAWDVLGGHYKTLGLYDDAIDAYQKAVSIDSTQAFYFHHLALVYAAVGRHDNAIHAFERVLEIEPDHGLAHATLGGYYRKNGNEELAKAHIEKARDLLGSDENEYNRACMESICGNADRSLELLEIALKNKQTYVNWARKDPDLDFIRSDPRFQALLSESATK